jgi:hypothetical protein
MFDLDQSIAGWRRNMQSAGIKSPAVLEELESHLRDAIENQVGSGATEQQAFETTVRQLGQSELLHSEFAKVRATPAALAKHFTLTLAGIPGDYMETNMNASSSNLEPRWATYLKAAAFLLPAVGLWTFNMIFVFPKFQELCKLSQINLTVSLRTFIALAVALKDNFLWISLGMVLLLTLLEWRATTYWPRYRRAVFGIAAFSLNLAVLIAISLIGVLSVVAAFELPRYAGAWGLRFTDTAAHISPFTMVRFDGDKVFVTYSGVNYELASVNNLPIQQVLDYSRIHYGNLWEKRFAQDLVVVLSDMGHPIPTDHTIALTLLDPATGQLQTVPNAQMTEKNRNGIPDTWD